MTDLKMQKNSIGDYDEKFEKKTAKRFKRKSNTVFGYFFDVFFSTVYF